MYKFRFQLKLLAMIIAINSFILFSSTNSDTSRIYGVTIDAVSNLSQTTTSLKNHCKKMTTRIVFDEWVAASTYVTPCSQIHGVSNVMGELLDSYYMSQYSYAQFVARVNEYYSTLTTNVDIWEIGNEVNGEWCGPIDSVTAKVMYAYKISKKYCKKVALTLYYNYNCWSNQQNEMFRWVNQKCPTKLRYGVDYLLVSYYEDDCNSYQPNWQRVFDSLHVLFPNAKLGMGECGTSNTSQKASYITRYYTMNVTTPKYIGGYFWWYYRQDCTPWTNTLWSVLNTAIEGTNLSSNNVLEENKLSVSPNPFNPKTKIGYKVTEAAQVIMKIYDLVGKETAIIVNGYYTPGNYQVTFDGSNLASGIYFCRLEIGKNLSVQKLVLNK